MKPCAYCGKTDIYCDCLRPRWYERVAMWCYYIFRSRHITTKDIDIVTEEAWRRGQPRFPQLLKRKGRNE